MGLVAERHDGLWVVADAVVDNRKRAVGLLIDERTRIMSVRGADGGSRDLRICVADGRYAPRAVRL